MNLFAKDTRRRIVGQFCLTILVFAVLGVLQGVAAATGSLSALLQTDSPTYGVSDAMVVRFTLANNGSEPVQVLPWNTPLEGKFTAPIFKVQSNGQEVAYIGPMVKRPAPTAGDYITIKPGEAVSATLNLAEGYAAYNAGSYSISFDANLAILGGPSAKLNGASVAPNISAATTLVLSENRPIPPSPAPKQATYTGCTTSETNTLSNAHASAEAIATEAHSALNNAPTSQRSTAPRYLKWFGTHTQSRYATVEGNFNAISGALSNQVITFNCNCNEPYYAYVYANNPYEIYICNYFWTAPRTGTDSQAGTIVHEVSHFTVVADTDDHAYGQTLCANLASSTPDLAIENADSHEYFAENTPPLSMGSGGSSCTRQPWDWAYCSDPNCGPCAAGEGDCDSDAECQSGLVCAHDVGLNYGQTSMMDVCENSSGCRLSPWDWGYCSDPNCGPCAAGEGDCDSDAECQSGLVCAHNVGLNYGQTSTMDVCENSSGCRLSPWDWAYCSDPNCGPCAAGEGDCDGDAECQAGLVCAHDVDSTIQTTMDVCEQPNTNACRLSPWDWAYCSDPNCGPCAAGEGDCDGDAECQSGLVCAHNVGLNYGQTSTMDVCENSSGCRLSPWDWAYCSDPNCGPCAAGEGDCDGDAECQAGLICAHDVGSDYGQASSIDVCQAPQVCTRPLWDWAYCSDPDCGPCNRGEGDCDSDSECQVGLVCRHDVGTAYGQAAAMDVCE